MFLDTRKNGLPEFRGLIKLVQSNIIECIADLGISQMLRVLIEYISVIVTVVTHLESSVDLVEDVVRHVIEVVIAS